MTLTKAISEWLQSSGILTVDDDVSTDWLAAAAESYGLYKQPSNMVTTYIDGDELRTEYYFFLTRQSAQQEIDRRENQEFLEAIEDWVDDKNFHGNYPNIPGIESVEITNSFYMQETEGEEAVYQISIGITYTKKRG